MKSEVRGVEIPDRDEEQLPFSLRIVMERGGAVCSIACQTEEDLINLRRGISLGPQTPPPRGPNSVGRASVLHPTSSALRDQEWEARDDVSARADFSAGILFE